MNILVVDDVQAVRVATAAALNAAGHKVTLASSGNEALIQMEADLYDVIITDIWMPEGDGLRLIKALRSQPNPPRVIAITGGGPKISIETAESLAKVWGAEHVLVKPFDDRRLVDLIGRTPTV